MKKGSDLYDVALAVFVESVAFSGSHPRSAFMRNAGRQEESQDVMMLGFARCLGEVQQ
jgi:hypothetical protein